MTKPLEHCGILSLYVYKDTKGRWVFDDPAKRIHQEPFVSGMDKVLDYLTKGIPNAGYYGFILHIQEGVGSDDHLFVTLCHAEAILHPYLGQSNWYYCEELGRMRAWICPVLYKYIDHTPQILCLWAEEIKQIKQHFFCNFFPVPFLLG